jgi:hypothetical protein
MPTRHAEANKAWDELIEQALLAERRLAIEEAAKIAEYPGTRCACQTAPDHIFPTCCTVKLCEISDQTAAKLRAAAEKEVGK